MPRRILNLALFGIGAVVFSIAAISANYWVYMQGAINAPDMKALKTAMQLAHENRMTDAEHTLEPFVFDTKNSSHECAKALAAMYAFDNKFDRMEEAVLVISCGKKEKVPNHMRNLGLAMVEQRPEIAAKVLERTAILQKESFGEDGEYGKDLYWTALSESTIGQRDQAIKHLQIAVPILEKHYGTASSKTPAAKELLNKLTTTSTKEH